jgi:hypothetical protein
MTKADPKFSAGARLERRSMRTYLRRQLRATPSLTGLQAVLDWVFKRSARYDKASGGLGKR